MEGASESDGAPRGAAWTCPDEMTLEDREVTERLIRAVYFFAGDEGDADFSGGDGSDVGLAVVAPVDFDKPAPWSDGVVLTKANAAGVSVAPVESGQGGDAGLVAVGADKVAGAEGVGVGVDDGDLVV